jgi:hypothetical protein
MRPSYNLKPNPTSPLQIDHLNGSDQPQDYNPTMLFQNIVLGICLYLFPRTLLALSMTS